MTAIKIMKIAEKYCADFTPPHGNGVRWSNPEPLVANDIIYELLNGGCHQADIGDALYEAGANWIENTTQKR